MNYWLFKSEPTTYGIDHLAKDKVTAWTGVRNYQARNFMRDGMKAGDRGFFYHSSCDEPGIAGVVEVTKGAYPDETQFDRKSRYYDAGSDPENPRWYQVEVRLLRKFAHPVTLETLREHADGALSNLAVLRRGNRLSVMPVSAGDWKFIHRLANESPR